MRQLRKTIRHILEMTRTIMLESRVPTLFWHKGVATSVYLLNRLPTKALNFQTPLQILSSPMSVPTILTLQLRVFGCFFVHIPKTKCSKFDPFSVCVFIRYKIHKKSYYYYNPHNHRIYFTMDCELLETKFYYSWKLKSTQSTSGGQLEQTNRLVDHTIVSQNSPNRISRRIHRDVESHSTINGVLGHVNPDDYRRGQQLF